MPFEVLATLGATALLAGLLATVHVFFKLRARLLPAQRPSPLRYFALAAGVGLVAYTVGTLSGIFAACSSPSSGNLCGLHGALGVGPLLAGIVLCLYGPWWGRRALPRA